MEGYCAPGGDDVGAPPGGDAGGDFDGGSGADTEGGTVAGGTAGGATTADATGGTTTGGEPGGGDVGGEFVSCSSSLDCGPETCEGASCDCFAETGVCMTSCSTAAECASDEDCFEGFCAPLGDAGGGGGMPPMGGGMPGMGGMGM